MFESHKLNAVTKDHDLSTNLSNKTRHRKKKRKDNEKGHG